MPGQGRRGIGCPLGGGHTEVGDRTAVGVSHYPTSAGPPTPSGLCWEMRWAPSPRTIAVCSPVPGMSRFLTRCLFPTVSEPQAAHSPPEKPASTAILCNTCGNVCRGEVLRVQNKYFHIQCFVCKGERRPVSAVGPSTALPCGRARLPAATLGPGHSLDLGGWKN